MSFLAIATVLLSQRAEPSALQRWDRLPFIASLSTILPGDAQERVLAILGKPDDVWHAPDFPTEGLPTTWETWCYGSRGHKSFPILGQVRFVHGAVARTVGAAGFPLPEMPGVNEAALRKALLEITSEPTLMPADLPGDYANLDEEDALAIIRRANILQPLGKLTAVAALCELGRLTDYLVNRQLYWICKILFTSPVSNTRVDYNPGNSDLSDEDRVIWPSYPVIFLNGAAFVIAYDEQLGGPAPAAFPWMIDGVKATWQMRQSPLVPVDNPFICADTIELTPAWNAWKVTPTMHRDLSFHDFVRAEMMEGALTLARTVCRFRVTKRMWGDKIDLKYFRRCEDAFLKAGGHWDKKLQMYVRRDGSHL